MSWLKNKNLIGGITLLQRGLHGSSVARSYQLAGAYLSLWSQLQHVWLLYATWMLCWILCMIRIQVWFALPAASEFRRWRGAGDTAHIPAGLTGWDGKSSVLYCQFFPHFADNHSLLFVRLRKSKFSQAAELLDPFLAGGFSLLLHLFVHVFACRSRGGAGHCDRAYLRLWFDGRKKWHMIGFSIELPIEQHAWRSGYVVIELAPGRTLDDLKWFILMLYCLSK